MSRFQELCDSYNKLISSAEEYENDCKNFTKKLVLDFSDFLEAGRNDISIKDIKLDDDGYYDCFIEVTLYEGHEKEDAKGFVPDICLKVARNTNDFLVKVISGTKLYIISKEDLNNLQNSKAQELYEDLFRSIKSYYETPIDDFIHKNMKGKVNFV